MNRWNGTTEDKKRFHSEGQKVLRQIAKTLCIHRSGYEIVSNPGGIVIGGEVSLKTKKFYLQITGGCLDESYVWGRLTDGKNVRFDWELLYDPPSFVKVLKLEGLA